MRYVYVAATGVLAAAAVFSSCTCHQQVSQAPSVETAARPSGFHASGPKITPQAQVQASAATPTVKPAEAFPQLAAGGPTPTPPADIPANFPTDVPIFKDAALSQVQNLANDAHNVVFTTSAPVKDVSSFYRDKMRTAGWKVSEEFERPKHAFMKFEKGDMVANVTIIEDASHPGKQMIAIMYEQVQPLPFDEF
ncbi:MAG: hypothetical protein U0587_09980 [Candidatus Binatia bacterium]